MSEEEPVLLLEPDPKTNEVILLTFNVEKYYIIKDEKDDNYKEFTNYSSYQITVKPGQVFEGFIRKKDKK